ncbi:MAG: peptidoglycan DD-metalloendopeptidase family protein [Bacteroidetes bacterium]|nr:peptidoglycan DD-metalloendopeptidase family protein [Bacteroidota bacterium]
MRRCGKFLLLLWLLLLTIPAIPQSKKELERKKQQLQKEIDQTNRELNATAKSKKLTASQVDALKKKIKLRQQLIGTINSELDGLSSQITTTSGEITSLEHKMEQLRNEYANMVRFAQRNQGSYQRLMFIFASDDFNQAFKRLKYLQQYSDSRKRQAALIDSTQSHLSNRKSELEAKKNEKTSLRNQELQQKQELEKDKKEQDKVLANLQDREKKLKKQLAEKQKAKQRLDRAIDNLIRKEIEAAKKKATASGKKNVTNANVFSLTPESQKLSNSFAGNKGKSPWPVEKGNISSSFGEHPHPELKGIVVKNNGIDIRSTPNSQARSVFDGEVSGVITIPGSNSAVIIRHGEYLSVYSNLESVFVKKGDKVTTRQKIGQVYTDQAEGTTELHLEIWKGTTKLNPAPWLAGK